MTPATLAAALVGQPWTPHTNCWRLVQRVFAELAIAELPDLPIGDDGLNLPPESRRADIARVCEAGSLRTVNGRPMELDIATLRTAATGRWHVGVLVLVDGLLRLLHCEGGIDADATAALHARNPAAKERGDVTSYGPGVVCEPLEEVLMRYHGMVLWRRTC